MKRAHLAVYALLFSMLVAGANARGLTDSEKAIISKSVSHNFNDPRAAQFRWMPLSDTWSNRSKATDGKTVGSQFYCGMVDGKNLFGAYTGFTPFLVMLVAKGGKVAVSLLVGVEIPADDTVFNKCQTYGLDPRQAQ